MDLYDALLVSNNSGGGGGSASDDVTQTSINDSERHRLILSNSGTDNTEVAGVYKNNKLTFNPKANKLFIGNNSLSTGETSINGSIQLQQKSPVSETSTVLTALTGIASDSPSFDVTLVEDTWDGTNHSLKDAIAKAGGGTTVVELTQVEYNALTQAEKKNGSIYMVAGSRSLDPNYSYYTANNDTIIVRVYHEGLGDEKIIWFFRGWNQSSGDMSIPSNLTNYAPSSASAMYSGNYPNGGTTQDGWIGFYNGQIRVWTQDLSDTTTGIMYGVVDTSRSGEQTNPYVDDPYVYLEASNKIYYMDTEYANTNGGGGYSEVTGTLVSGATSITLTDSNITTDSTFDIYTSIWGADPTDVIVATGSITLTFEAQSTDMNVKVKVS